MRAPSISVVAACVLVTGCASQEVTSAEYDEIAQITGITIATPGGGGDVGAAADSARLARGAMPAGFSIDAQTGMAVGMHGQVPYMYMVFCSDAQGAHMDHCGPGAVTSTIIAAWQGNIVQNGFAGSIERQGTWTMTMAGMMGGEAATIAGESTFAVDVVASTGFVHHHMTSTERVDLRVDAISGSIASGTISSRFDGTRSDDGMHGMQSWDYGGEAEATFGEMAQASLVVAGRVYLVDLTTGAVSRPTR